ncbi:unnamed protein product, partial [Ascophyllum nodosum]
METVLGTGTERELEWGRRRENEGKTGAGTGVETRGRTPDGNGDGSGNRDWIENRDGKGNENGEGSGGGGEFWYPPHEERIRAEDQALPFRARHHLCRKEVAPEGSEQLAQDPAPDRRYDTQDITGHHRREG